MEAVDIEKLLDELEKHEERRIDFASKSPALNNTYSFNNYADFSSDYSPASNYEHPSFEPIKLSDANFSVTSPPPPVQSQARYSPPVEPSTNLITSFENDTQPSVSKENQLVYTFKNREFKPDLIESNSDVCSSLHEFDRFERHLPDIASTDVEVKVDEKVNFDLITDSVVSNIDDSGIEDTSVTNAAEEIIRFPSTTDISDSELHQYLEELEKNELEETVQVCENTSNKISIQVPSEIEVNDYKERNEIAINDEGDNTVSEEAGLVTCSNEESERTSLNLNIHSGNVTTIEIDDKPLSDGAKTELTSVSTEGASIVISEAVNRKSPTEFLGQSVIEIAEDGSSLQSVTSDESGYVANENEEPTTPDNVIIGQMVQMSEALRPYEREEEKNRAGDLESLTNSEIVCNEAQTVVSLNNDSDRPRHGAKETVVDSLSSTIIEAEESTSTAEENCHVRDSETVACSSSLENNYDQDVEQPCTSKHADDNCVRGEDSATGEKQFKAQRPDSLNLAQTTQNSEMSSTSADSGSLLSSEERKLGKEPPVWIPDSESSVCMHCQMKFTLVRRRHHCRACGFVLCSKCCDLRASLEYLRFEEARVCHSCHSIIERVNSLETSSMKRPNPNNPMEYCSTIPPLLQVGPTQPAPPSVLVPVVGVLKREGRSKVNDTPKQVIFSDGIRPGGDLTELDAPSEPRRSLMRRTGGRLTKRVGTPPGNVVHHRRMLNAETHSFIPSNQDLPPLVVKREGELIYSELEKPLTVDDEAVKFAINRNLFVSVKRIILDCCVNRDVWCMTTEGLSCVGQDEVVFILDLLPDEKYPPKDVFSIVNMLYQEASKGSTVTELSFASAHMNQLFDSKEHSGFVFIRPTYQCVRKLLLPQPPFLIALLIHKWEAPWARLFPIRLVLRLGAEFRYYPCPLVSVRNRPALFTDIGNTIIGLLADFRKFSYSLPTVRGLMIHMEDRLTTILLPRNRYDQVIRAMNNSEENVLAFAGNISTVADSHLVCIQSVQNDISYHTQAINIHNKPRQVTGASFIVFNGSLKQCSWAGKSNIVEDGLMVQIPSESMISLRAALRQMNDYSIGCGPHAEERVMLKWAPDDVNFNIGVKSQIDNRPLDGVPSIRVHNGTDYSGSTSRLIRWTEVFILQSDEDSGSKTGDTVNISKLSESIARASCIALVPLLDLLATANLTTLAVRATIHPENVGYEAGSCGEKLRPLYMKRLDNELIAVVHEAAVSIRDISCPIVLELIFKIMEQG